MISSMTTHTYVEALGKAMKKEYEAIHDAGLMLQVDCPDLAMGRHSKFKTKSIEEFQAIAKAHIKDMNEALANIPAERIRMHVCWGNYPGPHHHDVPLADIIHLVLAAKPKYLSIEACNPGHGHEWEVFQHVSLPAGKVLMPEIDPVEVMDISAQAMEEEVVEMAEEEVVDIDAD